MEPALAQQTADGRPAKYQGVWSFNVARGIADGVNAAAWATGVSDALRAAGCSLAEASGAPLAPSGHVNPEVTRQPVGAGTDRYVWTAEAWFMCNRAVQGRELNRAVAEAFKNAGAGRDFPAAEAAQAMAACETVRAVQLRNQSIGRTAAEAAVPFLSAYRTLFADTGTVCATYQAFTGAPRVASALDGPLARAAAGPIDASNNSGRIGESPVVFSLGGLDVTSTELKVAGAVAGAILLLGTAGYFLRSVKVVTL